MRRAVFPATFFLVVVACVAFNASAAHADQEADAKAHFNRGVKLYNLGHFQEAIPEFEQAYEIDPAPILLFNIAQSHRQNGNNERALFFYRRFLEQAPNTPKRADVEQRMKELAQELQQENEQKQKPPTEVSPPPPTPAPAPAPPSTAPVAAPPAPPPEVDTRPSVPASAIPVRLALTLGPSFVGFSNPKIGGVTIFEASLGASYDFLAGPSALRAGVAGQYASLPFTKTDTGAQQSSSLWGAMLTVDYAYRVFETLSIGAGVTGGVVWWAGLSDKNPFTVEGVAASGAIPMPSFGVSLHADYLITPHLFVNFTPAFLYNKTTSDGLTQQVSSIRRFNLDFGAGYLF